MATAVVLTAGAPLLLTTGTARERAARPTVRPIASVLAVQIGLEGVLGVLSDKSHPISGTVFSIYRLGQLRRARASHTVARTPRVRRVLALQTWFWRANVLLLVVTTGARTGMRPDAQAGTPPWTRTT